MDNFSELPCKRKLLLNLYNFFLSCCCFVVVLPHKISEYFGVKMR